MPYKSFQRPVGAPFISGLVIKKPSHTRVTLVLLILALLGSSFQPERMRAADGDLDPGFGVGGIVTTDFLRGGDDHAKAVVIQKDDKLVVAGGNSGKFAVARYNPDGSLDTSFGNSGRVTTAFGTSNSSAEALALQSDGKIVVAGFTRNGFNNADFAMARYNPDGSLDTSFGNGGKVITNISNLNEDDSAASLAIQPADGKIIAGGQARNSGTGLDVALARYNPDGSLDTSFDGDGKVTTHVGGDDGVTGMVLQPDGRIVATSAFSALVRYLPNGSLDASFDGDGMVGTLALTTGVALQLDGKIIVGGTTNPFLSQFAVARHNPDGSLDASFGIGGIVTTDIGGEFAFARAVRLQSDGKIILAGGNGNFWILVRYQPNGTLDGSFGIGGQVFTTPGQSALDLLIQPGDGKIVTAGLNSASLDADFALRRHHTDGSPDTSFDTDGQLLTDFAGGRDMGNAIAIQADGKLVVAGSDADDFALARYLPNGSLDTSFDGDGRVTTDFFGQRDAAQAIVLQADGKIIAAGFTRSSPGPQPHDFALARYNPDGSLDTSFDGDGRVITDFSGNIDEARAVALQADGKIIVAGGTNPFAFGLARYNPDGSLDTSFDGDGKVVTIAEIGDGRAYSVVIQPGDGKIIAAGSHGSDFGLLRYNPDGSLDTSFDGDGKVVTNFGGFDIAQAVTLQADGKIVAAGYSEPSFPGESDDEDFALARYNPDGSLDTSFDGDGKVITNISSVANDDRAQGVAIQPGDGKIVAAGYTDQGLVPSTLRDFALVRYNLNGSLDTSFGGDGKVTTNVSNFSLASDQARGVAIQPSDGSIVAVGEAFNNGSGVDFALARYGSTDTAPPVISCPAGLQVVTPRPRQACAAVVYAPPVASDNLHSVSVVCAPPSGSCFPTGTTTVTCTATDAAGNTAACNFTVTVFDVLLQSDSNPNTQLLINSFTGDYSFCCPGLPPGQAPLRGRGQVRSQGSTIILSHLAQSFRLTANIDAAVGKGTASFYPVSGQALCPIQDRNIYDNLSVQCGNPSP
jgi:uncharacterized delta-60 repeat protein